MGFMENLASWSLTTFLLALIFKGTIAAFINGLAGGEITNRTRAKILLATILAIGCVSWLTLDKPADKQIYQPISQPEQPSQEKGIELI